MTRYRNGQARKSVEQTGERFEERIRASVLISLLPPFHIELVRLEVQERSQNREWR